MSEVPLYLEVGLFHAVIAHEVGVLDHLEDLDLLLHRLQLVHRLNRGLEIRV